MDSKSNRSYKLRTKQMAIHVRAFGQIDKPVITTKVEEELFTIDDLRNGKCAIYNDSGLKVLRDILVYVFPTDKVIPSGNYLYYFSLEKNNTEWDGNDITALPTQSAIKFFNQINK